MHVALIYFHFLIDGFTMCRISYELASLTIQEMSCNHETISGKHNLNLIPIDFNVYGVIRMGLIYANRHNVAIE